MPPQNSADSVVVPAIRTGSSTTFTRALGKKGVRTIAVSETPSPPIFQSRYCDETHLMPSPFEGLTGYRDALLAIAERPNVRTIAPLGEPDIYVLAKYRDEFEEHIATPWMILGAVEETQDRYQLFEAARSVDVPVPETRPLDEWEDWDRETVLKSRYSILVENEEAFYPDVEFVPPGVEPDGEAIVSHMRHEPMVQEYVPGDGEYGFFALFDRGSPLATFQHRRIRSYTYSGGASVFRESINDPQLESADLRLLDSLD